MSDGNKTHFMAKNIEELRTLVKERIDDASYKSEGVAPWVLLVCFVSIISFLISCDRQIVFESWNKIGFFLAFCLLLIIPMANLLYYLDSRDLIRKDRPSISTFYPNPFIVDNLIKACLLILIILMINISGKNYISKYQIHACVIVASIMHGFEWTAIWFKKKMHKQLFPIHIGILIVLIVLIAAIAVWILPDFTYNLDFNIIQFSLSSAAGVGLIYYCTYVFYLSPKTQLNIKLRGCYNRLASREILDVAEEEKRFEQLVNGLFFGELFLPDLRKLSNERTQIIQDCEQIYKLLDFKNDYSSDAFEKVKAATRLLRDVNARIDQLIIGKSELIDRVCKKASILPENDADVQQALSIMNKIRTSLNDIRSEFENIRILISLCEIKIEEFTQHYEKNKECLCKYAPYKQRFGHFIGCRIIPKIQKLFSSK